MEYTALILILPLLTFLALGLLGTRLKSAVAGYIGTLSIAVAALLAYTTAWQYFTMPRVDGIHAPVIPFNFEWLRFTQYLHIDLGILLDPISVMMLVVITTVSLMVHIYSLGYMHGERGFQRYYAFLSLFSFSMLGLVVATNIFQMYIFWELVGVSSYLLIGFYYTKPEAVAASKKAFIVTRFADLGFLIGILLLSFYTKTFSFEILTSGDTSIFAGAAGTTFMGCSVMSWAMALIFMGGAGKSAMFPLHIWLPDAMEGPTPVSALIHAATMVVAGVFLVARLFPVYFFEAPDVLVLIAVVGAVTSLYAAVVACVQTDIKRVLAFSTISQIGFMMVALGVSGMDGHAGLGYMASMFHLFTHAMFKALLFLGAGAIIHAVHSNEMSHMGGLRKYLPVTHITFLVACLAISGIPPFSGFFSKDEILAAAFMFSPVMGVVMSFIAALTAFYMFRLYYNIFWGKESTHEHTPHEAPKSMTLPLVFLAAVTLFAGFIPFGKFVSSNGQEYIIHLDWTVAITSIVVACLSIALATFFYRKPNPIPDRLATTFGGLHRAAYRRFYMDELYLFITKRVIFNCISRPLAWFDRHVIDGALNGLAAMSQWVSYNIRGLQSGQVQQYAYVILLGTVFILILVLI
ncbi:MULTISPECIES: NADH-quinone oxidoreductase subunit L [Butyricimonas]|uniref:NADH-quinone oxidoreductase subunit L n=1 Tax=Butyricimonas TaxID=574697 RepID=UPI001D062754|nr:MULTISPECIES: NADH-quinone oxidoreductase subunit L [Butyricimonas]MCB6971456.1 NADH-quinone oxidoreductase subunit L [Butyricimonas synergistica]MCG4518170.1 NADH-quinone oxidoreductase subunit L [Butyricimonas sp. DFI.6.44]